MPTTAPLSVLFFATRDYYHPATTGGDITMWEEARYLASVGHSVTFVAAGYPGVPKNEVLDGIFVVRLGDIHWLWLRTFWYYIAHCRGRFDVVVAEGFGGSRVPRMAPLYVREPFITEWHQIHRDLFAAQYPKILGWPLNLLERLTAWIHRDTLLRAGTEGWQRAFPSIGFKPENVFLVPVSIRTDWFAEPIAKPTNPPTIVWLGKFRRYKCAHHAIEAMSQLVPQVPHARLVLAGRHDDRTYERRLAELVTRLHLESNVEFSFDLDEGSKRKLLRDSTLMVVTSAVEGFGIVVLEANALGVPVVASNGVPEDVVRENYNGLRYPFGDIQALSVAIRRVLTDADLRDRLSANAFEFARNFTWEDVGRRFERIVRQAAAREPLLR
jgi:glycosyltransferase involved in cell wall biosynthesis